MLRLAVVCGILLVGVAFVAAQDDARLPIPAKEPAAAAEKAILDAFRPGYLQAKPADRSALRRSLLAQADESKEEDAKRFVYMREARDLSAKAGDLPVYLAASKKLAGAFRISEADAVAAGIDVLVANMEITPGIAAAESVQALVEAAENATRNGEFASAQKFLKAADWVARKMAAPPVTAAVTARTTTLSALRKEFDNLPEAVKTLETDPADKKANLLVGRYLCFVKNDWDAGLARLLLGAEGPLAVAVEKDVAAGSGGVSVRIEAGDQWKKLAATADPFQKKNIESRALHWYVLVVDEATGFNKARIEKYIQETSNGDNKEFEAGGLKPFVSKEGRFTVLMSGTPKETKWATSAAGPNIPIVYFNCQIDSGRALGVNFYDVPAANLNLGIEGMLDDATAPFRKAPGIKVLSINNITLGKRPGREVQIQFADDRGIRKLNLYQVGTRLYQVFAVGPESFVRSAQIDRFFKSFKVNE